MGGAATGVAARLKRNSLRCFWGRSTSALRLTLVLGGVLGLGMGISSPLTSAPGTSGESLALGALSGGHVAIDSITSAQPFVAIAKHARAAVVI